VFFFENGDKLFGKIYFMHPMGKPKQALKVPCFVPFLSFGVGFGGLGMGGGRIFFSFFSDSQCVPTMFSLSCQMGFHHVPQVPNVFLNMFSLAPHFYPIYML